MDQNPRSHRNKFPKQPNPKHNEKQKPLKVVYISNPIRVTTTAADFRGVVQELTGRDSDVAEILTRQPPISNPVEPCDSQICTRPSSELAVADGDNSLKLVAERFGVTDELFAGLFPLSQLIDLE